MGKKVIFLISIIVVLLLGSGGVFYWWQNQADVRDLNKTLPVGVRVEKSLAGEDKVVNDIDGYEFKVPKEWRGVSEVEYVPEREEKGYQGTSIGLRGKEGGSTIVSIDFFKAGGHDGDLTSWAKNFFNTFGLVGEFYKDTVQEFEIIKTQENVHLLGAFVYIFKKESTIYSVTNGSEDFIRYIITNGKW